jgi:hypothetical protein
VDWPAYVLVVDKASQWWWNVTNLIVPGSIVIMSLQNPREKIWGVMLGINHFGITLRGIDVYSFDDWTRSIANQNEAVIGLTTMFVPMIRVEKVVLDENNGEFKSFSEQFKERVGHDVLEFMNLPENLDDSGMFN